jgi:hypothetical protein
MVVSLKDAANALRQVFGGDVTVCLEPEEVRGAKTAAGKEPELWVFDPLTGQIRRGDGKFYAAVVVRHFGGYCALAIVEEPNVPVPADGSPRVIGHVIVDVNPRGFVRVRDAKCLIGPIRELKPSSISKGELAPESAKPIGYFQANPQRLGGHIAVYQNDVEFPDAEGETPEQYRISTRQNGDGRALSALALLGLLHG